MWVTQALAERRIWCMLGSDRDRQSDEETSCLGIENRLEIMDAQRTSAIEQVCLFWRHHPRTPYSRPTKNPGVPPEFSVYLLVH